MTSVVAVLTLALVLGAFVRLTKAPVPRAWRPAYASLCGSAMALADVLAEALPWEEVLVRGGASTALAIAGHLVLVEWLRGGRELGAKRDGR